MEIGSEFSFLEKGNGSGLQFPDDIIDSCYTFCGRTAIETVLLNESHLKKILVPSYCCQSMLEPLIKHNIEIVFFYVDYFNELKIDLIIADDIDGILWCNYFGFKNFMPDLSKFIKRGGIIIEDITHSLFSDNSNHPQSTYLVASIRKWLPVLCGGYVASRKKKLEIKPAIHPPSEFLNLKKRAMLNKEAYLHSEDKVHKNVFLEMFHDSNDMLSTGYSGLTIDKLSENIISNVDVNIIANKRRNNAMALYDALKESCNMKFMFNSIDMDCPLFVPIIVNSESRNNIKRKLVENNIYCPTHWPKPVLNCESSLYETEISLVCDQRYGEKDMQRIIHVICNELEKGRTE